MKETYKWTVIVVIVICALLLATIAVLIILWVKDKKRLTAKAEERYKEGKEEAADIIRLTIDKIQDEKTRLIGMTEKDLMVETMLALGGYGRRLDRIEEKIMSISHYKTYIDAMNQQVQLLSGNVANLQASVEEAGKDVNNFKTSISEIMEGVTRANDSLEQAGNIGKRTEELMSTLISTVSMLENINSQVNSVSDKMNVFFEGYSETPIALMNSIQSSVCDLDSSLATVKQKMSSVINSIAGINSTVANIKDTVNKALDSDENESLYYMVYEMKDDVYSMKSFFDDVKEDFCDLKKDIDDVKSSIESNFEQYGYDNIYSKIDELSDKIGSLQE